MKKIDKAIEALNRMDEFANESTRDNDNGEAEQLAKDYSLIFDFIKPGAEERETLVKCSHCSWSGEEKNLYSLADDDHRAEYCPNCHKGGTTKIIN